MPRTALRTWPRCLGSPISKVKRDIATRSREVLTFVDRMLTCWSNSTLVTSESSLARSSASTRKNQKGLSGGGRPLDLDHAFGLGHQGLDVAAVLLVDGH